MMIYKKCMRCGTSEQTEVTTIPHNVARADYSFCLRCVKRHGSEGKKFWGFIGYFDSDGALLETHSGARVTQAVREAAQNDFDSVRERIRNRIAPPASPVGNDGVIYRTCSGKTLLASDDLYEVGYADGESSRQADLEMKCNDLQEQLDDLQHEFNNMRQDRDDYKAIADSARAGLKQANDERDRYIARNRILQERLNAIRDIVK